MLGPGGSWKCGATTHLPLGFPVTCLLAFNMACFFCSSVMEKPGGRDRNKTFLEYFALPLPVCTMSASWLHAVMRYLPDAVCLFYCRNEPHTSLLPAFADQAIELFRSPLEVRPTPLLMQNQFLSPDPYFTSVALSSVGRLRLSQSGHCPWTKGLTNRKCVVGSMGKGSGGQ